MIDWTLFAARVPAGTRTRLNFGTVQLPNDFSLDYLEGFVWMLQENDGECDEDPYLFPEDASNLQAVIWVFPFDYVEDFWFDPMQSDFLIEGEWLTLHEVLTTPAQSPGECPSPAASQEREWRE